MLKLAMLLSILTFNSYARCVNTTSSEVPFWISSASGMGDKVYENLRDVDNRYKKIAYLPTDSIVKDLRDPGEQTKALDHYIPIEVIQTANHVRDEQLKRSRWFFKNLIFWKKDLPRAKSYDRGQLHKDSLNYPQMFKYVLKDNNLYNMGQEQNDIVVITPKTVAGKFAVKDCDNRERFYYFDVLIKRHNVDILKTDMEVDMESNFGREFLENIVPLHLDVSKSLISIFQYIFLDEDFSVYGPENMDYLHTLKLLKFPIDIETLEGPYSSFYYNPDTKGHDDIYVKLLSACSMLSVLREFRKHYSSKYEVALGDMYHRKDWNEHKSHQTGRCIDVRPVRNDGRRGSLTYNSGTYSRSATKKLVELMKKAGGSPIYFNDPKVYGAISGVSPMGGHSNHIHVCFHPTKTVENSCFNIQK